jgi:hypothetical protein
MAWVKWDPGRWLDSLHTSVQEQLVPRKPAPQTITLFDAISLIEDLQPKGGKKLDDGRCANTQGSRGLLVGVGGGER